MYTIKRFSKINILDYSDVIRYLKSNTNLKFSTMYRNGSLSSGVYFIGSLGYSDRMELIRVLNTLINEFSYQFTFAFIDNDVIKFNVRNLESILMSDKLLMNIKLFTQPTTKVKIDSLTEYRTSDILFHFTEDRNALSIIRDGLIPKGRNGEGYTYPSSVHLLTNLNHMVNYENGKLVGASKWKSNLIGLKINPKGYKLIQDPSCDVGVICYNKISNQDICLIEDDEYKDLFDKYRLKNYTLFDNSLFKVIN